MILAGGRNGGQDREREGDHSGSESLWERGKSENWAVFMALLQRGGSRSMISLTVAYLSTYLPCLPLSLIFDRIPKSTVLQIVCHAETQQTIRFSGTEPAWRSRFRSRSEGRRKTTVHYNNYFPLNLNFQRKIRRASTKRSPKSKWTFPLRPDHHPNLRLRSQHSPSYFSSQKLCTRSAIPISCQLETFST